MNQIYKYPRTQHIRGSRLQPGDEDLADIPLSALEGQLIVIEEKMDGANSAISFGPEGKLLMQSRGHYLTGGPRERHFALFKTWAARWVTELYDLLGSRYIMYGEWLYAKHTVFYNALSHYFMEFDILDTETGIFLSTKKRQEMLANYPFVVSVKVMEQGRFEKTEQLEALVGPSSFIKNSHLEDLRKLAEAQNLRVEQVLKETDPTNLMEGLYLKVENEDEVIGRYKYVRHSFLTAVLQAEGHWLNRPIIPNQLEVGVEIF